MLQERLCTAHLGGSTQTSQGMTKTYLTSSAHVWPEACGRCLQSLSQCILGTQNLTGRNCAGSQSDLLSPETLLSSYIALQKQLGQELELHTGCLLAKTTKDLLNHIAQKHYSARAVNFTCQCVSRHILCTATSRQMKSRPLLNPFQVDLYRFLHLSNSRSAFLLHNKHILRRLLTGVSQLRRFCLSAKSKLQVFVDLEKQGLIVSVNLIAQLVVAAP